MSKVTKLLEGLDKVIYPDIKDVFEWLEEYILEKYGEQCDEFILNCPICQQHLALQILSDNLEHEVHES